MPPATEQRQLQMIVEQLGGGPPAWENETMMALYRAIACTELTEGGWFAYELHDGAVAPTFDACDAIAVDRPYDPADYPIPAPVFYVEGTADPATPMAGAQYHLQSQAQTDRTFIAVDSVGHLPLMWALASDCSPAVWRSILDGGDGLDAALTGCSWSSTATVVPAGE